ncbi:MAG: asparagine synthase (glutamine-hydrolyzing) [Pelagibacteraceae bacterium]|nr:asparagine synthase (glutamine-hydrolyzing) [Pelagibacteraceae bacterium]PPR10026.1 MAG: Asparagine synthetase [glutamine-hydrolyzing] 3 [Alphaproteobacteria bacterium MarineAlpha11_Bin1]|tara:strand:+ start:2960 stop:4852 length:1893 start_codon:yes stop_codon:yes gene_type:complete
MCAIAGIATLSAVNQLAVKAMTDLMIHRGPDGEGHWLAPDGSLCFGHRRLSIIDLTDRASQPMQDASGRLTLTYNGEIYNYKELRAELSGAGANFRSESDSEVILEAYRKWGDACLDRFNGMFAFALYDAKHDRILCARDRLGEKPFLFAEDAGFFAFASDYKALLTLEGVGPDIDDNLLAQFLVTPSNALDQDRNTLFHDIQQLLPGEKLVLNTRDLSFNVSSYWRPLSTSVLSGVPAKDAVPAFKSLLEDAVRIRLRSDVRVGSCLSGGLDSGSITCIARDLVGDTTDYDTFTGRFPGSDSDEGTWAEIVSTASGTRSHNVFPTGEKLVESLDTFLWLNELPVDSTSQFSQWSVFEAAKNAGVTVLLDGQGGDEILAGYEQYFVPYIESRRRKGEYDPAEEKAIRDRYPLAFSERDQVWKRRLPPIPKKILARFLGRGTSAILSLDWKNASRVREDLAVQPDDLHAALRGDAFTGFLTTLLRYGDRNSMAHSREVRLPFCDHRIYEFVRTLPVELLMGDAETKHILRRSMRGILPEPIITRWGKQGFLPPIARWLEGDLGDLADALFKSSDFSKNGFWDTSWCRQSWNRFRAGETSLAPTIWKVIITQKWRDLFLTRVSEIDRFSPHG